MKIRATELVDAEAEMVSIVERGANRRPWKIRKSDEPYDDDTPAPSRRVQKGRSMTQLDAAFLRTDGRKNLGWMAESERATWRRKFAAQAADFSATLAHLDAGALSRKLLIAINAMIRDQRPWQPAIVAEPSCC